MTAPDFLDWVPPQSTVAASRIIASGTLTNGGLSVPFDTSAWQSVNIVMYSSTGLTQPDIGILDVYDSANGRDISRRPYSFQAASWSNTQDSGIDCTIPVLGTSMYLEYFDQLGTTSVTYVVTGLTRQLQPLVQPYTRGLIGPVSLDAVSASIPANTNQQIGYTGPFTNGVHVGFAGAATLAVDLYAGTYDAAGLAFRGIGGLVGAGSNYEHTDVTAPGTLIRLNINNTASSAATAQCQIIGY